MTETVTDGAWDVDVDRHVCIGAGVCVGIAPDRFRIENGRSRPVPERSAPADDAVIQAAETCPALAISVRHSGSGVLIAPDDATGE